MDKRKRSLGVGPCQVRLITYSNLRIAIASAVLTQNAIRRVIIATVAFVFGLAIFILGDGTSQKRRHLTPDGKSQIHERGTHLNENASSIFKFVVHLVKELKVHHSPDTSLNVHPHALSAVPFGLLGRFERDV